MKWIFFTKKYELFMCFSWHHLEKIYGKKTSHTKLLTTIKAILNLFSLYIWKKKFLLDFIVVQLSIALLYHHDDSIVGGYNVWMYTTIRMFSLLILVFALFFPLFMCFLFFLLSFGICFYGFFSVVSFFSFDSMFLYAIHFFRYNKLYCFFFVFF